MHVRGFTFNPFSTNCFVCHDGGEAVVVDPACSTEAETRQVLEYVDDEGLRVTRVLLTHAHIDHVYGCRALADAFGTAPWVHRDDAPLLAAAERQAQIFGVRMERPPEPAGFLSEGDEIEVGAARWKVIHTPGHSPGSVSFVDEEGGFVISGDVLFMDSIGRTDLWMGSLPILMRSIFERILSLDDATTVYCGHGPATTVGRERRENPFLLER